MPGLFGGFGNYFVPIFQGSPEVVSEIHLSSAIFFHNLFLISSFSFVFKS